MANFVVIALNPEVETSQVVGPFRSYERAMHASEDLRELNYNTEICELTKLKELLSRDG